MAQARPQERPLIFITNDDGIASPGLHAAMEAVAPLGNLLVVAPKHQQTGAGRSFPPAKWEFEAYPLTLRDGTKVEAYALAGSPAQAVRGGLMLLSGRPPDLLVSGINYGENVGVGVTISGTVGAAIEGATLGVPSLAVSLETAIQHHLVHSEEVDFSVAAHFTHVFARMMLELSLPPHTDLLKLDIPADATLETPWRITRVSRQNYFSSTIEERDGVRSFSGYERQVDLEILEEDSDIYAILVDGVISLTPMTIDLTAQSDFGALAAEVKQVLGERPPHSWPPGPIPDELKGM
ncbi:MAG: 5'/3'-nucleotidase SurE [Chloroflexota bacterium]|nr:5'/3'-nucleotidase SurE [Chloroflexota bacterium]